MTIGNLASEMTVHPSLFENGDYPVQKPGSPVDKQFAGELRGAYTNSWIPAWSLFGNPRSDPTDPHNGVDIYAPFVPLPMGTVIVASVGGRLEYKDGSDGNKLGRRLHLCFAFKNKGYRLIYGHLAAAIKTSGKVNAGEPIGYAGCSGNADHDKMCTGTNKCGMTTGHVHLMLMEDATGGYHDPLPALGWKLRYQDDGRSVDCSQAWG